MKTGPTNKVLKDLIQELRKKSRENDIKLWKRVADDLEKPTRKRRIVNLYNINQNTKDNEIVIVPGKVLATGEIDHAVTVAAFSFSGSAEDKINRVGKAIPITELMKESPAGKKIRILG
ncbi:50S ribosomal protein L18e [Candidatus Woesearchaeota archaeon]|nr:50S ribosomal protein L18e [Candidatus Woesearchaeota archaeon]